MRRVLGGMPRGSAPPVATRGTDGSMMIILAALLCALVFALGLNSAVRCLLRRAAPSGTGLPRKGLGKRALRRIPVAVFGEGAGVPAAECPICLGEFADGEKVRVLPPCNHSFHASCVDTWLAAHSSCPTCRQSLQDGAAVPAPGGTAEGRWIPCC